MTGTARSERDREVGSLELHLGVVDGAEDPSIVRGGVGCVDRLASQVRVEVVDVEQPKDPRLRTSLRLGRHHRVPGSFLVGAHLSKMHGARSRLRPVIAPD